MKNESPFVALANEFALSTNQSIFLTGKAGTGKTTFLHKLKTITKKQMAVVAPTGVAAINAGGTTIHSFFQLPFTPFLPTAQGRKDLIEKIKMAGFRRKVIQELELLVIDEISMVRADVLDAIDTVLRHIRFRHNDPFGGVQVIFIGDMFQLSPVAVDDEWRLLSGFYDSPYFFHSLVVKQQTPVYIELDKIYRQSNQEFISVLNQVRNNKLTPEGLAILQSRYNPTFVPENDDTYITLTTHNYKADKINATELEKIKQPAISFKAQIKGDFNEKNFPTDENLTLKIGAKVMFIKNDNETVRRFYNGKIGVIQDFNDDKIFIQCPGDEDTIELGRMMWENVRYTTNDITRQIEEDVAGSFTQFPLRLAWAITIHKSQGLTFEKTIIDAGEAFAPGQVYVALSRCRSLEGIVLLSKINPQTIENDRTIVEHQKTKPDVAYLEDILVKGRNSFTKEILIQLFNYQPSIGYTNRLIRETLEVAGSFNEETIPFLKNILQQQVQLQEVSDKFKSQLIQIFETDLLNQDYLTERLKAAIAFFNERNNNLLESILQSPAITDSRDNARNFTEQLKNCFAFIELKKHIFNKIQYPFNTDNYFELKNNFHISEFKITAYAKTKEVKAVNSENPKLYFELLALRNKLCEPRNLPIYLVAGSNTLLEISNLLPMNSVDLLKINGFGPSKVEKYGEQFIEIVKKYCEANHLTSKISTQAVVKRKKTKIPVAEKAPKIDTYTQSYDLYKSGKSIVEIAASRNLVPQTICTHLSKYVRLGILDINQFVSAEKRNKAIELMKNTDSGKVIELISTVLNPYEITFFLNWYRLVQK